MHSIDMLRRAGVLFAVLLATGCAEKSQDTSGRTDVRVERTDKEFDLDAGIARVAIDNPWGEINVKSRDEREIGIHAVIQHLPPKLADVDFKTRREGDTLYMDVVVEGATATSDRASAGARADIAVYLPTDLALKLSTRD